MLDTLLEQLENNGFVILADEIREEVDEAKRIKKIAFALTRKEIYPYMISLIFPTEDYGYEIEEVYDDEY